jgi:hypothetical protein
MESELKVVRTTTEENPEKYTSTTTTFYEDGSSYAKVQSRHGYDDRNDWEEYWYDKEGRLHRDSTVGPASIVSCPAGNTNIMIDKIYYTHGEVGRMDDGPTHEHVHEVPGFYYREKHIWTENGLRHRKSGPAVVYLVLISPPDYPVHLGMCPIKHVWYHKGVKGKTVKHEVSLADN